MTPGREGEERALPQTHTCVRTQLPGPVFRQPHPVTDLPKLLCRGAQKMQEAVCS